MDRCCELCADKHAATHWCVQCQQVFCQTNVWTHQRCRATMNHEIRNFIRRKALLPDDMWTYIAQFLLVAEFCAFRVVHRAPLLLRNFCPPTLNGDTVTLDKVIRFRGSLDSLSRVSVQLSQNQGCCEQALLDLSRIAQVPSISQLHIESMFAAGPLVIGNSVRELHFEGELGFLFEDECRFLQKAVLDNSACCRRRRRKYQDRSDWFCSHANFPAVRELQVEGQVWKNRKSVVYMPNLTTLHWKSDSSLLVEILTSCASTLLSLEIHSGLHNVLGLPLLPHVQRLVLSDLELSQHDFYLLAQRYPSLTSLTFCAKQCQWSNADFKQVLGLFPALQCATWLKRQDVLFFRLPSGFEIVPNSSKRRR